MTTRTAPPIKRDFANRARHFVERVPGFPILWVVGLAAVAIMVLTGGFGTDALPLGRRIALWLLLIGWNIAKWQLWFAWRVRRPADWNRAALIGAIVLNLPLPLEIAVALRAVGVATAPAPVGVWPTALAISGVIAAVVLAVRSRTGSVAVAPLPRPDGPVARGGVPAAELIAITAEDHYCRLHRRDGSSVLIHARFADALADVAALGGLQTHRGAWVAADAVAGADRVGRRWQLVLVGGTRAPVSARHASDVRARGWLRRSAASTPDQSRQ